MDAETAACPQPMFKALRADAPVMNVDGVGVVLSRRADIDDVFRHPEVFSSNMDAVDLKNDRPLIPLQIDPPEHRKFRKILDPLFAPRQVAVLEEPITALVNDLIDGFGDRGEVDFAQEFSVPFPSQVFLTLLGLPLDDLPLFLKLKDGIIRPNQATGTDYGDEVSEEYQRESAQGIYAYFNRVLDERETEGQDDLLTRFLHTDVEGQRLTRDDILDICFLFLLAGLDTVTATLDCMFAYLAQHPERRQQLVDDPSLVPAAIEELLRWETPVMAVVRVALEDTSVGGCPVHRDDQVVALLGSANTDEAEFPDADEVRFDRDENRHLAFGGGIHRCLGSHLARLELRVALREWHRRIPDYAIAAGHTLEYTPGVRSIDHFPLVFAPVPAHS
jgi:cytochrome P450